MNIGTATKGRRWKKKLNYNSLRDLSDNIKPININIIGDSKGEEREEG